MSGGDLKRYICDVDRGSSKAVYWRYFAREPKRPAPINASAARPSVARRAPYLSESSHRSSPPSTREE